MTGPIVLLVAALVALVSVAGPSPAAAQPPTPPAPGGAEPGTAEPTAPTAPPPASQGPTLVTPPPTLIGANVLIPPVPQGPITLTPSITVSEEFNDNVFQNNRNKRSDFITAFTPGVTLAIQQPEYRLTAGFNFSAELYAKETELNSAFSRSNLFIDGFYRLTPRATLTVGDTFIYDRNSNVTSAQGISSGRTESWSNTFAPGLTWQATPLTALRLFGSYTAQRFLTGSTIAGATDDTDTYRAGTAVDHIFTPRFTGTARFEAAYLGIQREPDAVTLTPQLGATYRFTETITGSILGGPTVVFQDGDTDVAPAGTATYSQRFSWGVLTASYTRSVGAAGGFGRVTDDQSFSGSVNYTTLLKGFVLGLSPRYSISETLRARRGQSKEDIEAFTLGLNASYQVARTVSLIASYNFFTERVSRERAPDDNIDQNRVFLGVQFGYPFNFN